MKLRDGMVQDIAWEVNQYGDLFLVQARPVTVIAEIKSPTQKIVDLMLGRLFVR